MMCGVNDGTLPVWVGAGVMLMVGTGVGVGDGLGVGVGEGVGDVHSVSMAIRAPVITTSIGSSPDKNSGALASGRPGENVRTVIPVPSVCSMSRASTPDPDETN